MTRNTLTLAVLAVFLSGSTLSRAEQDQQYTYRFARLSYIEGQVNFQHSGDVDWSAASINMTLQPADRIYTGEDGRAEIEFDDGSVLRLAERADVEILTLKEERIQLRQLIGLSTLTAASSVSFEIDTPAAAYTAIRKGVYRFDVHENGDTDAIVRKGVLDAASNHFSRRIESDELLHVTSGDESTQTVGRYTARDAWDEWIDRRNADNANTAAYDSRKYLPGYVTMGVRELDRYGRWVDVDDYGPAWVPLQVDSGWSPYYDGRWVYRPFWGWTWVSYEPWGWLPYHYGRWHWSNGFGWAWLPGASFGFHFWSPGLVRFYRGSGWLSWCPLGPGDYYNVNHYYYNPTYRYYVNDLRLTQRRGPGDLANRNVAGAFRTARTEDFTDRGFGRGRTVGRVDGVDRPWEHGRLVTDRLDVAPTRASVAAAPDRTGSRPASLERPVVVRSEPSVEGANRRYVRINDRSEGAAGSERGSRSSGEDLRSGRSLTTGRRAGETGAAQRSEPGSRDATPAPRIWNRRAEESPGSSTTGRVYEAPPARTEDPARTRGREAPGDAAGRSQSAPAAREGSVAPPRRNERSIPEGSTSRSAPERAPVERAGPQRSAPAAPSQIERPAPEQRQAPERRPPERRPDPPGGAAAYTPRVYQSPVARAPRNDAAVGRSAVGTGSSAVSRSAVQSWTDRSSTDFPQRNSWARRAPSTDTPQLHSWATQPPSSDFPQRHFWATQPPSRDFPGLHAWATEPPSGAIASPRIQSWGTERPSGGSFDRMRAAPRGWSGFGGGRGGGTTRSAPSAPSGGGRRGR